MVPKNRPLAKKDMEGIHLTGSSWENLLNVCERARDLYIHENGEEQDNPTEKTNSDKRISNNDVATVTSGERPDTTIKTRHKRRLTNNMIAGEGTSNVFINNRRAAIRNGPEPPPPLPEAFKNKIIEISGGRHVSLDPTLVIQKGLFETDLNACHNRVSIPLSQVREDFLTDKEKGFLNGRRAAGLNYKEVIIIEPSLNFGMAKLSKWDRAKGEGKKTSSCYVINGTWKDIVKRNDLTVGTVLQFWAFKIEEDQLGMAIIRLPVQNPTE